MNTLRSIKRHFIAGVERWTRADQRLARESREDLEDVVAKLAPAANYVIDTKEDRPRPKTEILFHHVHFPDRGTTAMVVEKRTNNPREKQLYQAFAGEALVNGTITPKVYNIHSEPRLALRKHRYRFLIEGLPIVGVTDRTQHAAEQLARCMLRITDIPVSAKTEVRSHSVTLRLVAKFSSVVRNDPALLRAIGATALGELRANWTNASAARPSALPLVPSHNDLHYINFGRRSADDPDVKFFDWEQFGLNVLGADLHQMVVSAESNDDDFSRMVYRHYVHLAAAKFSVDGHDIEVAAHHYALYKLMKRTLSRASPDLVGRAMTVFRRLQTRDFGLL